MEAPVVSQATVCPAWLSSKPLIFKAPQVLTNLLVLPWGPAPSPQPLLSSCLGLSSSVYCLGQLLPEAFWTSLPRASVPRGISFRSYRELTGQGRTRPLEAWASLDGASSPNLRWTSSCLGPPDTENYVLSRWKTGREKEALQVLAGKAPPQPFLNKARALSSLQASASSLFHMPRPQALQPDLPPSRSAKTGLPGFLGSQAQSTVGIGRQTVHWPWAHPSFPLLPGTPHLWPQLQVCPQVLLR